MIPPSVRGLAGLILLSAITLTPLMLQAASVAMSAVADTFLSQTSPDNNFGGELFLSSGLTDDALVNRALLKFDVAANVPSNATIQKVTLTLNVTHSTS